MSRPEQARELYLAFAAGDRDHVEGILTDDFRFSSPPDPDLDRAAYFERCWPGAGRGQRFEFVRLHEIADEVVVTYELTMGARGRGRNTEILTFRGNQICRAGVSVGWNVD